MHSHFLVLTLLLSTVCYPASNPAASILDHGAAHDINMDDSINPSAQQMIRQFVQQYNDDQYDRLFERFDDIMKVVLPKHDAVEFFDGLKTDMGNIIAITSYAPDFYGVTFAKGHLAMTLSHQDDKIAGVMFGSDHHVTAINTLPKDAFNDELFKSLSHAPNGTQMAVAIIDGKNTQYHGIKRSQDSIVPYQNDDALFEIGSITKPLTATLLADAVVARRLNINGSINHCYPALNAPAISFLSLANHTSGLPRLPKNFTSKHADNPYEDHDVIRFERYVIEDMAKELPPMSDVQPHKVYYSNLGYALLGDALAKSEGKPLPVLFDERIFGRYGMSDSHTDSFMVQNHPKLVKGQDINGQVVSHWQMTGYLGAGGVVSSVRDLSKFAQAHFANDPALTLSRQPTTVDGDIALAWHLSPDYDGWVWHNGATGGYSGFMAIRAASQKAVIILSNIQGDSIQSGFVDELGFYVMQHM